MSPRDPHSWGTAQGTAGGQDGREQAVNEAANLAAESVDRPLVTSVQDTLAMGVRVPVEPTDVLVGGQTGLYSGREGDVISGGGPHALWGDTGAGEGHAGHFRHPNAQHGYEGSET
jgi:hypothetical protein